MRYGGDSAGERQGKIQLEITPVARHHEHAHKGISGSSELLRFPIEQLEWTYRVLSKAQPAHTRPLCRRLGHRHPRKCRAARYPLPHVPSTTRPTWFRTRYPLPAIRLGRASKASIAALLATYLLRDRAFSPLGARLS